MEEKVVRRYSIIQDANIETRYPSNKTELDILLKKIKSYNGKKTNPLFCGNVNIENYYNGSYIVDIKKYKKITMPSTLQELDEFTTSLDNSARLKEMYNVKSERSLYIGYRNQNDIKKLPILYKDDKKYIQVEYVRNEFIKRCFQLDFIYDIFNDKFINSLRNKKLYEQLDILMATKEKIKANVYNIDMIISPAHSVFREIIYKDGELNYNNLRYLGCKIRELEKLELEIEKQNKKKEGHEEYQLTFDDILHKTTK